MGTSHLIAARVSPETKAKFRDLAEQQQMTKSALLKQLIELTVQRMNQADADVLRSPARRVRAARLYVRLHPEDQLLLTERAAARQMPAATYVSVLIRAHLRDLAPLPKAELMALKRSVAELGAIGRNLNQLTRLAHHQTGPAGPDREDLRMMLKVCEAMRDHTKDLIKASSHAWRVGHGNVPS
ncbi:MAG: plasmid mobilization relaxosome protein MobC [Pseudomonadota bacterium]|nr:plasmid mobilization relaxosome protein MobC [Pseudomonadota bacterium]